MADDPKLVVAPTEGTPNPSDQKTTPPAKVEPPKKDDGTGKKPDAKPAGNIYSDIGEDEPGKPGATTWPTDWREQLAGSDAKALEGLKRFTSPDGLAKSWLAAQQRIRSGEYKRAEPLDKTPEAMKAWRTENDVPETPAEYEIPKIAGVDFEKLDETTKASIDIFRNTFHEMNMPRAHASAVTAAMIKVSEVTMEAEAQRDAQNQEETEDALMADWGANYKKSLNANLRLLEDGPDPALGSGLGKDLAMGFLDARMPDGRKIGNIPEISKWLNTMARSIGSDVMVDSEAGAGQTVEAQIEAIKQIMATDMNKYYKEGHDKKYTKLLEIQERRGKLPQTNAA